MNLQYKLKSGRNINIELQSGRTAILSSSTILINEERLNKKIIKLSFEDSLEFKLNDILNFKIENINSEFQIKEIIRNDKAGRYYLSCAFDTYTNYFVFPLIVTQDNQNRNYFRFDDFMIGTYLNKELSQILLLVRYFPGEIFSKWEETIKKNPYYLEFVDINTYSVLYKFQIPKQYSNIINLFIEGRYSSFDESIKKKILIFHNAGRLSELHDILYKSKHRKNKYEFELDIEIPENIDLYNKPNMNNEIFEL